MAIGPLVWVAPLGLLLDFEEVVCHPDPDDLDYDVALNTAIDRLRELGRLRAALGRTGLGLDRQDDEDDEDEDDDEDDEDDEDEDDGDDDNDDYDDNDDQEYVEDDEEDFEFIY